MLLALTETNLTKELQWGTTTPLLGSDERGAVPKQFETQSRVCIIANSWDSSSEQYQALESRGHVFHFNPSWAEVYKMSCDWFWDQEIADYIHERLEYLSQPDCRLFQKAWDRKEAGLTGQASWQALIDSQLDPICKFLNDDQYPSINAKAKAYVDAGHGSRATFYRKKNQIPPSEPVDRIELQETMSPLQKEQHEEYLAIVPINLQQLITDIFTMEEDGWISRCELISKSSYDLIS